MVSKRIIRFFLLIFCIGNSPIYPLDFGDLKNGGYFLGKWTWNAVNQHLLATMIGGMFLFYAQNDQEKGELEKELIKSKIVSQDLENKGKHQQNELQSRSDWQEAQIKMMAAAAYEATDPTLVKQRIEEKNLELREKKLKLRVLNVQVASQVTSFLEHLKEKMIKIEGLLKKDESLSEEKKRHLYSELIRFGGIYKGVNSPIAS